MYALAFYIFLSILELKKECDVQCSHVMKSKTTLICLFTHTQFFFFFAKQKWGPLWLYYATRVVNSHTHSCTHDCLQKLLPGSLLINDSNCVGVQWTHLHTKL